MKERTGSLSPNWNLNREEVFAPYATDWTSKVKQKVFERDKYVCQNPECWGKNGKIVPHHIDYDKMNCDSTNLITLCNICNMRSNYDKEKWKLLYEEKIRQRRLEKLYNMKMIMGVYRNKEHDSDWWPIFFRKRFLPRVEEGLIPKNSVCLDFSCQNYPDEYCIPEGHEFVSFDFYKHFDGTLPYEDNTFDAIIAHGSINKSSEIKPKSLHPKNIELVMTKRVRKRIAEGKMTKGDYEKRLFSSLSEKAYSICGGSHVLGVPWMIREKVVQRWSEFYRVGKDGAVWFLTCLRHGRFHRWAERILTDEDRQGKTVHIVNF